MTVARGVLVVFEGLDGAGKSSAARETARELGAEALTTPSLAVRKFRDLLLRSQDAKKGRRKNPMRSWVRSPRRTRPSSDAHPLILISNGILFIDCFKKIL